MTTYAGGKQVIGKEIARTMYKFLNKHRITQSKYWEPFAGMCSVLKHVQWIKNRYASDLHHEVISMWKKLQQGWEPPQKCSEEEYLKMKNDKKYGEPWVRGYIGHGFSFSGLYFASYKCKFSEYDRGAGGRAYRGVKKTLKRIMDVRFLSGDYQDCGEILSIKNAVIYCDPPYNKTTKNVGCGSNFNHDDFWNWVRIMTLEKNCTVFVSEFTAPSDFVEIWSKSRHIKIASNQKNRKHSVREKLFVHKSILNSPKDESVISS